MKLRSTCKMFLCGLAATAGFAGSVMAADFNWRFQSNLNPGEPGFIAAEVFADVVAEMSGGRLEIEIFNAGSLFPIAEGLDSVGLGIAEMAALTGGYFAGKIGPFANLETGVPGSISTPIERYSFFYDEGFLELAREVYGKHGVFYLGPQLSPSWDIVSNVPITSAEDFEGLKIRAFGIEAKWYESLGAASEFLSGGEVYTALATGRIDAARWSSPSGNLKSSYQEVVKYYIQPSPMPVPNNFIAVNPAAWDSLPDDLKAILEAAVIKSSLTYLSLASLEDAAALAEFEKAGVQISTIPDEEWQKMQAKARVLWEAYADEDEDARRGVEMLHAYLKKIGKN